MGPPAPRRPRVAGAVGFETFVSDLSASVVDASEAVIRKEPPRHSSIDLNAVVQDVALLVHSDAIIRNIAMKVDLVDRALAGRGAQRATLGRERSGGGPILTFTLPAANGAQKPGSRTPSGAFGRSTKVS